LWPWSRQRSGRRADRRCAGNHASTSSARDKIIGAHPCTPPSSTPSAARRHRPLRVIPFIDDAHRSEIDLLERADRLAREVHETLQRSPVSAEKKAAFERQAREVPDNVNQALWNLARLRRLYASIDPQSDPANQNRQAISDLENKTLLEMTQSVELLASLSVSLIQVELARGDRSADRLLADLDESNKRLVDLSSAYAESKQLSA
jgi:hypothetical protein